MSADNHLHIEKTSTGKYAVYNVWEEQEELDKPLQVWDTLVEAIQYAEEYMQDNCVEYGIRFGVL
jgi:DNA gyrase inhibitor GyrI